MVATLVKDATLFYIDEFFLKPHLGMMQLRKIT